MAKPATDEQIAEWKEECLAYLKDEGEVTFIEGRQLSLIARIEQEEGRRTTANDLLREARDTLAPWTCPECGPNIRIDEDGCCATCGVEAKHNGTTRATMIASITDHLEES